MCNPLIYLEIWTFPVRFLIIVGEFAAHIAAHIAAHAID